MGKIKQFIKNAIEGRELYKYPLFISYPRSGSHWINSMMELYFDRPRLRRSRGTFRDKKRRDWMWMADHDIHLKVLKKLRESKSPRKILFLHRNPADVIFSHLNAKYKNFKYYGYVSGEKCKDKEYMFGKESVLKETKEWLNHHQQYLENHGNIEITVIKYENFLDEKTYLTEFKKICDHFNLPFNKHRIERLFKEYGKIDLDKNKRTGAEEYKKEKKYFMKKWKALIEKEVKKLAGKSEWK